MPVIIVSSIYPTIMTDSTTSEDIYGRHRWGMLGVVYFCLLVPGMAMQTVPPLLTAIVTEFNLLYAQGGLLMSFFALPAILIAIPAGMLADRYNQKAISIISLTLVIAGTILFFNSNTMHLLILGRTIAGIGSVALFVLAPQIVAQWFAEKELGFAIGILNTSIPLSSIIALNLFSLISDQAGWRTCIYPSVGLPLLAITTMLFFFTRAPMSIQQHKSHQHSVFHEIRQTGLSIWLIAAAWMFFNVVISSFITFTPDYLQMNGFSIVSAGFITSALMWPSLIMSPAIGFIMDRIGHKHLIIVSASMLVCLMVGMVPYISSRIIWLVIFIGIVQSMISAPLFTLASEVSEPQKQGVAFGIMATFQNIGAVLGPFIIGFVRDATGAYQSSYLVMSGSTLLIIVSIVILSWKQRQQAYTYS
jgi:predicted MFS family arabinose efflux permease